MFDSDGSLIDEIEKEIQREKNQFFWKRYKKFLIAASIALVFITISLELYQWNMIHKAASDGDSFIDSIRLGKDIRSDQILAKLREKGRGVYKVLSNLLTASKLANIGELEKAVKQYNIVINNISVDRNFRDIARIRSGMILVDIGSIEDVKEIVGPLVRPEGAYKYSAQEVLGLAYLKIGDFQKAFQQFSALQKEEGIPAGLEDRVQIMLELIKSGGATTE
ncbi:tetratricopeptide repeat protein [Candidatus Endowatersipora endosymbiont of Watersipora subatra]|uniref:tetratricopeptide repeat protein n=1 Tax=Candidatus Endowatersipora endosymbiont of Watersipora subatra TaxID=3077946 RepID=UPI00312C8A29